MCTKQEKEYFNYFIKLVIKTKVNNQYLFLGLIGGIMGLFLGFSIISVVELLYFFTIRPILVLILQYRK